MNVNLVDKLHKLQVSTIEISGQFLKWPKRSNFFHSISEVMKVVQLPTVINKCVGFLIFGIFRKIGVTPGA